MAPKELTELLVFAPDPDLVGFGPGSDRYDIYLGHHLNDRETSPGRPATEKPVGEWQAVAEPGLLGECSRRFVQERELVREPALELLGECSHQSSVMSRCLVRARVLVLLRQE
jgi:hypothetical protein